MNTLKEWIREISPELKALDTTPLTGVSPFSWDLLGTQLAKTFQKERFIITPSIWEWRSGEMLFEGFQGPLYTLAFSAPPLKGNFYCIVSEQSIQQLKTILLTKEQSPIFYEDREFDESFCRFLALEALFHYSNLHTIPQFAPILLPNIELKPVNSLCIDIAISIDHHDLFPIRLIIPSDFHREWTNHIKEQGATVSNEALAKKIEVVLHVQAAYTHLNLKQWQEIRVGDFILFDQYSLKGETFQGRVILAANNHSIFHATLKQGKIKILDFPLYQEVRTPMSKNNKNNETQNEEENSDEFEFEDSFDFSETEEEKSETEEEKEEEFLEQEEAEGSLHDDDEEEKEIEEDNGERKKSEAERSVLEKQAEFPPAIPPEQIPISLVVELGRIQMTVGKLLEIEPGNFLEIDVHPENGVDLMINGKFVGRGEIVRLGEAFGVRILELG